MPCELCDGDGIERWRVHYCNFARVCLACGGTGRYMFVDQHPLPPCPHRCDRSWTGHWRDFHRGHGCDLDPAAAATRRASLERATVAPTSRFHRDVSPSNMIIERQLEAFDPAVLYPAEIPTHVFEASIIPPRGDRS